MLSAEHPSDKDIVIWLLKLKRWAQANGLHPTIWGPILSHYTEDDIQEGKRYFLAAIANLHMKGDLAALDKSAPEMRDYIQTNWLAGKRFSDVLEDELLNLEFVTGMSLHTFLSAFWLIYSYIEPTIPARRACELFAEKLPGEIDPHIQIADNTPGRDSVKRGGSVMEQESFRAWANKVVQGCQLVLSRRAKRDKRLGVATQDALTTSLGGGNSSRGDTQPLTWGDAMLAKEPPQGYHPTDTAYSTIDSLAARIGTPTE